MYHGNNCLCILYFLEFDLFYCDILCTFRIMSFLLPFGLMFWHTIACALPSSLSATQVVCFCEWMDAWTGPDESGLRIVAGSLVTQLRPAALNGFRASEYGKCWVRSHTGRILLVQGQLPSMSLCFSWHHQRVLVNMIVIA